MLTVCFRVSICCVFGCFADCVFQGVSVCGLCVSGCFCMWIVFQGVSIHFVFQGVSVCCVSGCSVCCVFQGVFVHWLCVSGCFCMLCVSGYFCMLCVSGRFCVLCV